MIEFKEFGNKDLYDNFNITFSPGINILIGDNGCGKSTLINYIFNLYDDYSGDIIIDGNNIKEVDPKGDIAIVFQNPYVQFIGYDVLDEISYYYEQHKDCEDQTLKLIEQLGFSNKPLNALSGGEAQLLNIYKSIYIAPKILIIDEALSNISKVKKDVIINHLKQLDICVLLITNNTADYTYADNMYLLKDKKITQYKNVVENGEYRCNDGQVGYQFEGYEFLTGYNLLTGNSGVGKSFLLNRIFEKNNSNFRIIKQYPFSQIYFSTFDEVITRHKINRQEFIELMNLLNLELHLIQRPAILLSTGELTLLFMLLYYMLKAEYYLFDESIEVIDEQRRSLILELFADRNVIFITHNISLFNSYPLHIVEVNNEI